MRNLIFIIVFGCTTPELQTEMEQRHPRHKPQPTEDCWVSEPCEDPNNSGCGHYEPCNQD